MFVANWRADGAGDRSPYGDFWFTPVGARTSSGVMVTGDAAMQLAAVYACVRVLSESFAVLPFVLYRPRAGGGRERVTRHWLYDRFARRPNRWQTPFEWREMLQGHLALRGNAFCEIVDDGMGGIAEFVPLHPDRIKIETLPNGDYRYRYRDPSNNERVYRRDQVWHLRGLSGDGVVGYSPLTVAREALGEALAMQSYSSTFYANDARPGGGWIEFPGRFADAGAKQAFRESWKQLQGGSRRGSTAVLDQGMKYHELGVTNRDAQFLEGRKFKTAEIARIFRVPPHKIGDLERATFSNIEQQSIEFWVDTMLPWTERWESSIESMLLGEDTDLEVEFDFRRLMRGDATSRAQYLHNMVLDGILTRNEAREEEGYDPIEGLDEPLVPVNERELSDPDPNGEQGAGEELPDAVPGDADEEGADAKRLQAILRAQAGRLARRAAGALAKRPARDVFDAEFAAVIAESLSVDDARAALWCGKLAAAESQSAEIIERALLACANGA